MKSLHCRIPGPVIHPSDVCFQTSLQQGCLQVGLFRMEVCLRRSGSQHEQRIINRFKHLHAQCAQCHLIQHMQPYRVLYPLADGVQILSLLFFSLRQDVDYHPKLTRYRKLFSVWPSRLDARSSSCSIPATCSTCAWRFCKIRRVYAQQDA